MAEVPGSQSITQFAAILTFAGALLAPVIGTIASLLSRSGLQRKQQEAEFKIKRLELIEKALTVGQSMSNIINVNVDVSLIQAAYLRLLSSIPEPEPASESDLLPFERYKRPIRWLFLPKPASISGWITSLVYYLYTLTAVAYVVLFIIVETLEPVKQHYNFLLIFGAVVATAVAVIARYLAIRQAKKVILRNQEKFRKASGQPDIAHSAQETRTNSAS